MFRQKAKMNKVSIEKKKLSTNESSRTAFSKNESVDSGLCESHNVVQNAVSNTKFKNCSKKNNLIPNSASSSQCKENEDQYKIKRLETGKKLSLKNSEMVPKCSSDHRRISVLKSKNRNEIPLLQISSLSKKPPNQILLNILDKNSGVSSLLNERNINLNRLTYLFIVFGKACSSDMSANLNIFLQMVNSNSKYALLHMHRYMTFLQNQKKLDKSQLDSILFLTTFLQKFQSIMSSSSSNYIFLLLPLLNSACEKFLKVHEDLYHLVSAKLEEVKQNQHVQMHNTVFEVRRDCKKEKLHLQAPSESYRSLSVLPVSNDIKLPCLFLRPNIVKGKYENVEHYLDVQFRLLREDYVKPLRDGIAEYLNIKKNGQSLRNCKNVKVYTNVRIDGEDFLNGDLLHVLKFSDKGFANIKWTNTKRLLTQSLLCLSLDDFQTMLFACVIRREPQKLKKGLLFVRFEEITKEVLYLNRSMKFTVIETSAYFEAYRHNLMALQQLNAESLPLKEYIIDVQKTVAVPQYLQATTTYDMRPLLLPLDKTHIEIKHNTACYKYLGTVSGSAHSIKVMDECCWPSATDMNLDYSQYIALKAAITKEFAIIQGPPGTGKTFIGLRIVQLLLHNLNKWFSSKTSSLPILIVCKTNHALDQFLEGLLLFTSKIVRIGGGSSNEKILEFQLYNLKKSLRNCRNAFCQDISKCLYKINLEMKIIKNKIDAIKKCIEKSANTLLSELELKEHMPVVHFETLVKGFSSQGYLKNKITVSDWLGVALNSGRNVPKHCKSEHVEGLFEALELNEEIESEDEADVEYIESQRNIDFYDFENFSYKKNSEPNSKCVAQKDSESFGDSEWQAQESREQGYEMDEYIRGCLEYFEAMTEHVAITVTNVWDLDHGKRWQLYKYWLQNFIQNKKFEFFDLMQELKVNKMQEIIEMRTEEDLYVLERAHVVGMTTNGAAKYRHLVQRLNPMILVVEEAAEVLESHIVTSLAPNTQQVILIGDQQQLRPSPTVHMLAVKYDLDISLFERMVMNGVDYCRLSVQHRMRPEIATLIVPHIYSNLENHKVVTEFENVRGVEKNVCFMSHCFNESSKSDSKSKANEYEAKILIQLCRYLILQGYHPSQITVLTTYSAQLFVLRNLATGDVKKVRFSIVDNFQGEENDIILISFVRSNVDGIVGFLKVPNRVCVALSRAKKGLFCIGNFSLLAEKSSLWKNIVNTLIQAHSIGPSLRLRCQNHPDTYTEVVNLEDFQKVSQGGCFRKCEYRCSCGHDCILMCHPYDQGHEQILCVQPCLKTCERNHQCKKKCFQKCYCKVFIDRTLKQCGHTMKEMCGKPENEIMCLIDCERILSCTHQCTKKCGEKCGRCMKPCIKTCERDHQCENKCSQTCYCKVFVDKILTKCEHVVKEWCGKPEQKIICPLQCEKILSCTHPCSQKCGERCVVKCEERCLKFCDSSHQCQKLCFESCGFCEDLVDQKVKPCGHTVKTLCWKRGFSSICSFKCNKILPCSHQCSKKCGETCETSCEEPCLKTCEKGHQCENKCFEICYCVVKVEKTLVKCGHTIKDCCGKREEEIICSLKCEIKLNCNHYCTKKCGESCVNKCMELTETVLPTCGHSVKVRCHIANSSEILLNRSTEELFKACSEPCKEILLCGHKCSGTCGSCYQQRLHVQCNKVCDRILICGHKCQYLCSKSCPPCHHPCENRCIHSKCHKKCGQPCNKCSKSCEWSCSHKNCTNLCNEICNREPCNESCMEILPCGHLCIGLCGEPCPKVCRICDEKTEGSIFYKLDYSAKFVLLEDCGHVFEVQGLNQWMMVVISEENKKILMKTCPICKTVIRKNFRYNNVIKCSLLQLETIKKITGCNRMRNLELQRVLLQKSVSLISSSPYNNLNQYLSSFSIRNINELVTIENIIAIAADLNFLSVKHTGIEHSSQPQSLRMLVKYARITSKWVVDFILKSFLTVSEQQLLQLAYEVHRLRSIDMLLQFAKLKFPESQCLEFEDCSRCLQNYMPFNRESEKAFALAFKVFTSKFDDSISTPIEFPFLKAMNMSTGHWYECSKKHIYCITKHIGSIEKGCYECMKKSEKPLLNHQRSHNALLTGNSFCQTQYHSTSVLSVTKSQAMHNPAFSKMQVKQQMGNLSSVRGTSYPRYSLPPAPLEPNFRKPYSRPSNLSASMPVNMVSGWSRPSALIEHNSQKSYSKVLPSRLSISNSTCLLANSVSGHSRSNVPYAKALQGSHSRPLIKRVKTPAFSHSIARTALTMNLINPYKIKNTAKSNAQDKPLSQKSQSGQSSRDP